MDLSNEQLIEEAVAVNHRQVKLRTVEKYETYLEHFSSYLRSAHGVTFYKAQRKHIVTFVSHLQQRGGPSPHKSRVPCEWCRAAGYPDGRHGGPGWSPQTIKNYMAAVRFLYEHFAYEDDLPSINPTVGVHTPPCVVTRQYTPTSEEVKGVQDAPGRPRDRLLAFWTFYAPSRRQTYSDALWKNINLEEGWWDVVGKGDVADFFDLHPLLVRELRAYRKWQTETFARKHRAVADALANEDTAFVLLTCNGRKTHPNTVSKMLKWRARRAGVAVETTTAKRDCPTGQTSRISPHAMRRGWGTIAHNEHGVPMEVLQQVYKHKHLSTTQTHYVHTKPERARQALRQMKLS
jgi:integrase